MQVIVLVIALGNGRGGLVLVDLLAVPKVGELERPRAMAVGFFDLNQHSL